MADGIRDYGLGKHGDPVGPPKVEGKVKGGCCPNCGCESVYTLRVRMVLVPQLKGMGGVGTYIGCPACPWASPMAIVSEGGGVDPAAN
jgi:hypothetical protein